MSLFTPLLIVAAMIGTAGGLFPQRGETLPYIDISTSPNGIVLLPDNVPQVFRDAFVRYTKVVAPNSKPIHILAQDGWSEARILKARNVLKHILTDVPGTRYGADKSIVANTMADNRANIILPGLRLSKEQRRKLTYELKHLPWIPLITIGIMVFAAVFAPILAPYSPTKQTLSDKLLPPA